MIELTVIGTPKGKGRPRFNPKTRRAYTPAATKLAETYVIVAWQQAGCPRLQDGPVRIEAELVLARPGGHFRVNGDLAAAGLRCAWPTKKPDADNVLKLLMDSLNGAAYRDDAQIVDARVVKRWCRPGEREHTVIRLSTAGADEALAA